MLEGDNQVNRAATELVKAICSEVNTSSTNSNEDTSKSIQELVNSQNTMASLVIQEMKGMKQEIEQLKGNLPIQKEIYKETIKSNDQVKDDLQNTTQDINPAKLQLNELFNEMKQMKMEIESIQTSIQDLNQNLLLMNDKIVFMNKSQRIEWAMNNCSKRYLNDFSYYEGDYPCSIDSTLLIRDILTSFKTGLEMKLPRATLECEYEDVKDDYRSTRQWRKITTQEESDSLVNEFHDKISEKIQQLLGVKPRISVNEDGSYSIHSPEIFIDKLKSK